MRAILIASIVLAGLAGGATLLAQTSDELDMQAIKARAAAMAADAETFVAHVKDRGDALREEATSTADGGQENLKRLSPADLPTGPKGVIDFDELVAGAVGWIVRDCDVPLRLAVSVVIGVAILSSCSVEAAPEKAHAVQCTRPYVYDGDYIRCEEFGRSRLYGIDALEIGGLKRPGFSGGSNL